MLSVFSDKDVYIINNIAITVSTLSDKTKQAHKTAHFEVNRQCFINQKQEWVYVYELTELFLCVQMFCPDICSCQTTSSLINSSLSLICTTPDLFRWVPDNAELKCLSQSVFQMRSCYDIINRLSVQEVQSHQETQKL